MIDSIKHKSDKEIILKNKIIQSFIWKKPKPSYLNNKFTKMKEVVYRYDYYDPVRKVYLYFYEKLKEPSVYYFGYAQISLPKLLYGINSILIKTQDDLDLGFKKAINNISYFLDNQYDINFINIDEIDLVQQIDLCPNLCIQEHKDVKYEEHRKRNVRFYGKNGKYQTLKFIGSKTTLSVYDKPEELADEYGIKLQNNEEYIYCTRIEASLKGDKLKKEFDEYNIDSKNLEYNKLYKLFRDKILLLDGKLMQLPLNYYDADLWMALSIKNNWHIGSINQFESWKLGEDGKGRPRNSINRKQKVIDGYLMDLKTVYFKDYFLEDRPIHYVEIDKLGNISKTNLNS